MRYILDTNVVSALMKGDGAVLDRLAAVSRSAVFVPYPVLAEIEYGIERLPKSNRPASAPSKSGCTHTGTAKKKSPPYTLLWTSFW